MSAVEIAIEEVRKMSPSEAKELLAWLGAHRSKDGETRAEGDDARRRPGGRRSIKKIEAWYDSIRFRTNWEPRRMPDDLARRTAL